MRFDVALGVLGVCLMGACGGSEQRSSVPASTEDSLAAEMRVVNDVYHGVTVSDPYQWLEGDSEEVKTWATRQNEHARSQLNALPGLEKVSSEIKAIFLDKRPRYFAAQFVGDQVFALKLVPPAEQASLIVFADQPGSSERVLIDPTTLGTDGTTSVAFFAPSPIGSRVAVALSNRGSERGDVRVLDVASGAQVGEIVEHVIDGTAGGEVEWVDEANFYYTRYPRTGERPKNEEMFYQQLWFHNVEAPVASDRYELGKELPRIGEISIRYRAQTGELLANVQNGDGGDMAHYLRRKDGAWRQLSKFGDNVKGIFFGPPGTLFVLSRASAPNGKILVLKGGEIDVSKAAPLVAEAEYPMAWGFWQQNKIRVTSDKIFIIYQAGGPSVLRAFDHLGKRLADPPQAKVAAVFGLQSGAGDEVVYFQRTFTTPTQLMRLKPDGSARVDARLSSIPRVDLSDAHVSREFAISKDGTKVPVNIIHPKNAPIDGTGACIVTGYGGYGVSLEPGVSPLVRLSLDRNVCYAIANLRGGGEFGPAWHHAGRLEHKQNVFDDFIAVLEHLVAQRYAARDRLGIFGGSNGGLLMGAVLTQRPDLPRAVVSSVGIYDSVRNEVSPNGEFNVTEYGTVKNKVHFDALLAYSPYHNIRKGVEYPAVLLMHGDNDPRVAPWQSRKMAARLQASGSRAPVLLRTSAKSGHGSGSLSEAIASIAHHYAFIYHQLGVK